MILTRLFFMADNCSYKMYFDIKRRAVYRKYRDILGYFKLYCAQYIFCNIQERFSMILSFPLLTLRLIFFLKAQSCDYRMRKKSETLIYAFVGCIVHLKIQNWPCFAILIIIRGKVICLPKVSSWMLLCFVFTFPLNCE